VQVSPPAAPAAPAATVAPEDPAPVAAGGDPDDYGYDTEDGDKTEDDEEGDDKYYEGPREGDPYYIMHSSEVALGYFPWLLQNTLLELGNSVYPIYVTQR
jgi:hypothetical protein